MDALQEQRMVNAHQLGRRDYQEGKPETPPVYLSREEQDCYVAGYRGDAKRAEQAKLAMSDLALTRATVAGAVGGKATWYGQYRETVEKPWRVVRNLSGYPIAYASEQAALDGAEFMRTRPTGRWMK